MKKFNQEFKKEQPQKEIIDVEKCTNDNQIPPEGKWYRVRIGDRYHIFLKQFVSGREVLEVGGITHLECYWLYQRLKGCDFERIQLAETINLAKPGIEKFIIKPSEVFHYYVDNEPETTDKSKLTPIQILEAAGITPTKDYYLVKLNSDGSQESFKNRPNIPIKMACPALKFISVFNGETPVS